MATVTEPILTDATGQDIVDKLDELVGAVRPTASDIPLTPPSGMTATNVQDGFSEIKQSLSDLASELVSVTLSYNSSSSGFIIPNDVLTPSTEQICCTSRNIQTGAIYICWYDKSIRGFRVGVTVSGNAPTNGQKCSFEYFA